MKLKDRKRIRGQTQMLSTVGITLTRIERTLHGKGSPGASLDDPGAVQLDRFLTRTPEWLRISRSRPPGRSKSLYGYPLGRHIMQLIRKNCWRGSSP
jgi:hypothetical protein